APRVGAPAAAVALLLLAMLPAAIFVNTGTARGRTSIAMSGLTATILLAAALLYAEYRALGELPFDARAHTYGAVVGALIFWHALHVALALLAAVFALARAAARGVMPLHSLAPRVAALFAYYVIGTGAIVRALVCGL